MTYCPACKMEKDQDDFYIRKSGKNPSCCKECSKDKSNEYYRNNKSHIKQDRSNQWKSKLKAKYGLSDIEYERMYKDQNGLCKICETPIEYRKLCVDHDHNTGTIRGLLCMPCNIRLGVIENVDKLGFLEKMLSYIK
jgi:RNA polymerase-binding transcription factor DksA